MGGGTSVVVGQTAREPTQVFDTVTQQYLGGQQQAQAKPQYQKDGVYQDANGNKQKWDGAKFVPV